MIDNSMSGYKPSVTEGLETYGSEFKYWDENGCAISTNGNCFDANCDGILCDICRETWHGFWGLITKSVHNLMTDPKPEFTIDMVASSGLDSEAVRIIMECYNSTAIHLTCKITYRELLPYVSQRISKSPHRAEMLRRLNSNLLTGISSCVQARFNQTMNALVGYYDDVGLCA